MSSITSTRLLNTNFTIVPFSFQLMHVMYSVKQKFSTHSEKHLYLSDLLLIKFLGKYLDGKRFPLLEISLFYIYSVIIPHFSGHFCSSNLHRILCLNISNLNHPILTPPFMDNFLANWISSFLLYFSLSPKTNHFKQSILFHSRSPFQLEFLINFYFSKVIVGQSLLNISLFFVLHLINISQK